MNLLIAGHAYGVDGCVVEATAKLSEVASSAKVVDGTFGKQVCFTIIQGGMDFASPKGDVANLEVGADVPLDSNIQRVKNVKTGHESYRVS